MTILSLIWNLPPPHAQRGNLQKSCLVRILHHLTCNFLSDRATTSLKTHSTVEVSSETLLSMIRVTILVHSETRYCRMYEVNIYTVTYHSVYYYL